MCATQNRIAIWGAVGGTIRTSRQREWWREPEMEVANVVSVVHVRPIRRVGQASLEIAPLLVNRAGYTGKDVIGD